MCPRCVPANEALRDNFPCGKSFGFKVTRKSALPSSAQAQKQLSPGSGGISTLFRTVTSSASSLSRFTSRPATLGRTFSRFATSLYSSRISGVTSQTNLPFSTHCRRVSALGFLPGVKEPLKAEIPEITTDVSTTTLRPRRFWLGLNGDLWPLLFFVSVLADSL